jgi:DNA (cytosine-5)-methyltransferase 1
MLGRADLSRSTHEEPSLDGSSLKSVKLTSLEVCAGAGGQALGLEMAGFSHLALAEIEPIARETLRLNRPSWNVLDGPDADIRQLDARRFRGVDLLAGGLPCPPFSVASKQLGEKDERNLFPDFLRLVDECQPRAIFIENVKGFLAPAFAGYRKRLVADFKARGYAISWKLLNASDFGVSQLRPRVAIVGLHERCVSPFNWPAPADITPPTVGTLLLPYMQQNGWRAAKAWAASANTIAPTLVGGSRKHGGPDLGPTRAREAWAKLGVEGRTLADAPPGADDVGMPRLTVAMAARIQGFPADWAFAGRKTAAYRQVGNAFPPPVAKHVGREIARALQAMMAETR